MNGFALTYVTQQLVVSSLIASETNPAHAARLTSGSLGYKVYAHATKAAYNQFESSARQVLEHVGYLSIRCKPSLAYPACQLLVHGVHTFQLPAST